MELKKIIMIFFAILFLSTSSTLAQSIIYGKDLGYAQQQKELSYRMAGDRIKSSAEVQHLMTKVKNSYFCHSSMFDVRLSSYTSLETLIALKNNETGSVAGLLTYEPRALSVLADQFGVSHKSQEIVFKDQFIDQYKYCLTKELAIRRIEERLNTLTVLQREELFTQLVQERLMACIDKEQWVPIGQLPMERAFENPDLFTEESIVKLKLCADQSLKNTGELQSEAKQALEKTLNTQNLWMTCFQSNLQKTHFAKNLKQSRRAHENASSTRDQKTAEENFHYYQDKLNRNIRSCLAKTSSPRNSAASTR